MDKEKIIKMAKDAGLVFNTELMQSEVYPHHRKSLYLFASMIEFSTQEMIALRFEDDPVAKTKVFAAI